MKNTNMRQVLAVAFILLFVGVAFAPSINASTIEDELVEFDVELCGLGKKHTVKRAKARFCRGGARARPAFGPCRGGKMLKM